MALSGHQETLVRFQPRSFVVCLRHSTIPDEPFVTYASSHAEAVKVFGAQYFGRRFYPSPELVDVRVKISGHQWHRLKVSSVGDVFDADGELLPYCVKGIHVGLSEVAEVEQPPAQPAPPAVFDGHGYLVRMLERLETAMAFPNILHTDLAQLTQQALVALEAMRPRGGNS